MEGRNGGGTGVESGWTLRWRRGGAGWKNGRIPLVFMARKERAFSGGRRALAAGWTRKRPHHRTRWTPRAAAAGAEEANARSRARNGPGLSHPATSVRPLDATSSSPHAWGRGERGQATRTTPAGRAALALHPRPSHPHHDDGLAPQATQRPSGFGPDSGYSRRTALCWLSGSRRERL